MMMTLAKC